MQEDADKLPDLKASLETAQRNLANASKRQEELRQQLAAMPTGKGTAAIPFPSCAAPLEVRGGAIVKAEGGLNADALARQELAHKAIASQIDEYAPIVREAQSKVAALNNDIARAQEAAKKLKDIPSGMAAEGDVDAMRTALRVAEADLKAFTQKTEADRLHRAVLGNQRIVNLLAPEGVRKQVLQRALGAFNEHMAAISDSCGWLPTTITHDLTVEYGGRPYSPNCSESEQFRARTTLQIAIAKLEGAAVVIDGADVLDNAGRTGLFKGLHKLGMCAVVGMMANKQDAVPDLKAMGIGATYWIEAGVAKEVPCK
jgi:hypothetical protein